MIDNYYCQEKFTAIQIKLYDGMVSSCCQTTPQQLRYHEIKDQSGAFFNYPSIIEDRRKMLANEKVEDCQSCWLPESQGLSSRRTRRNQTEKLYHTTISKPKIIDLNVSNACNQTCVYCCKYFSNSWLKDILNNGPYDTENDGMRFKVTNKDLVINSLGQKDMNNTRLFNELLRQIAEMASGADLSISGGEPFLNNDLPMIVTAISDAAQITITSGLHVETKRLLRISQNLKEIAPNIRIRVSVENISERHEFVRFGSQWPTFLENLQVVKSLFDVELRSTLCNLTVFGLKDFLEFFDSEKITLYPLADPAYLRLGVLDPDSKHDLIRSLNEDLHPDIPEILKHLSDEENLDQRHNLARFLPEFAKRRKLDLAIFPQSFLHWLAESVD